MIFKKSQLVANHPRPPPPPKNWKQKLKLSLYRQNYNKLPHNYLDHHAHHDTQNLQQKHVQAGEAIVRSLRQLPQHLLSNLTSNPSAEPINLSHAFCVYVPLKKSVQFDDEIVNTFSYLRGLKEGNNLFEQDSFYMEMRKFLRDCKQKGKIKEGWLVCLKRFVCELDVLRRVEIFLQLQKSGSKVLKLLHETFCKEVLVDIFIERVMAVRINKTWKISVDMNQKINQSNISKTMKMLYCSLCMAYDCGKHKLEETSHRRDYHYCSPKNMISQGMHITKSIELLKQLRDLQLGVKNERVVCCSERCFRKLTKENYYELQIQKSRKISPMVQSIIKIGLELFSYSPCQIKNLFPDFAPQMSRISCEVIFLYLIEQVNLEARLTYKISPNQVDYLRRQYSDEACIYQKTINRSSNNPKKRKGKLLKSQQFKYQPTAICFHCFIGQQPFDQGCRNCACHLRGFCLPQCQCSPHCTLMIRGCSCKSKQQCQNAKCACYQNKIQCVPGICNNCFAGTCTEKKNNCRNDQILREQSTRIRIGFSKIPGAGLGAFAGQKIKKGSLVSIYCGEVLDQEMESIRETLKRDDSFYNFACSEGSIDARYMGNQTRFINHGNEGEGRTNVVSLNVFSLGQQFIGLYAARDIEQGEELLFDYDAEGQMDNAYTELYSFLRKNKAETEA